MSLLLLLPLSLLWLPRQLSPSFLPLSISMLLLLLMPMSLLPCYCCC